MTVASKLQASHRQLFEMLVLIHFVINVHAVLQTSYC